MLASPQKRAKLARQNAVAAQRWGPGLRWRRKGAIVKRLGIGNVLASVFLVTLAACDQPPARVFSETAVLEWESARDARDADALAEAYTEDAQVLPPGAPLIEGRAAIRTFYRNEFESGTEAADFDAREIIVFGDVTYRQGVYSAAVPGGGTEYGKFIQLWKKVDGVWKLHRSMWSANGPPLAGPTAGTP